MSLTKGAFKGGGPQCDAPDFMFGLLQRLGMEERALEGYKAETSRGLLYELFGFIVRSRYRCLVDGCRLVSDCCEASVINVQLVIPRCPASVITLEELWHTRWRARHDMRVCCRGGAFAVRNT